MRNSSTFAKEALQSAAIIIGSVLIVTLASCSPEKYGCYDFGYNDSYEQDYQSPQDECNTIKDDDT